MAEVEDNNVLEEVNKLRKSWEIEDHWILRRDFLLVHKNRFSPEKLLSMAQIFVNVETLKCGYSDAIMEQIKDLTDDIPSLEEFRKRKADLEAGKQFLPPPKKRRSDNSYNSNYNNRGGYGRGGNNYGGGGYNRGGYNQGGYNQGYNNRGGRGQGWSNSSRGRPY